MKKKTLAVLLAFSMICSMGEWGTVSAGAAKRPVLNKKKITLEVGETAKLSVKKVSKKKIKKKTFRSNKKKVVSVSKSGRIKAKKEGKAVVTCVLTMKNKQKYKLRCRVTVEEAWEAEDHETQAPIGTATSSVQPSAAATVPPIQTAAPTEGGNPQDTGAPQGSEIPGGSGTPEESGQPVQTSAPEESDGPKESGQPIYTDVPDESEEPKESGQPIETDTPIETTMPAKTKAPDGPHLSANGIMTSDNGEMRADMTPFQLIHEMGIGINLGNTMESVANWLSSGTVSDYEKAWGAPITTQEMITGMKKAGFTSIRIPVAWSNMMSKDGTYQIDDTYFDRVEEIMNYALNEDMYVIVNIHYDGGWWARFGSKDASERAAAMEKYKSMWTQIANRYEEYSDHLIFESANEELGERLNSKDDYANSGYFTSVSQLYDMLNQINQTFVDVVRGTGGNNSQRYLLLAGYDTSIDKTCDGAYEMPEDTMEDRLMVSVHFYSPATYCIAEKTDNSWGYQGDWGTAGEVQVMKDDLDKLRISFTSKGIPVIIGEYAVAAEKACDSDGNVTSHHIKKGRDLFFRTLCEYSMENGICPMLWDVTDPVNGVYDRLECAMRQEKEKDLYLELAQKAADAAVFVPAAKDAEPYWNGMVSVEGWNMKESVAGEGCNIILTQMGAACCISQVNWDDFKHPMLVLHAENSSGTVTCNLSREINQDNPYWPYIKNIEKSATWDMSGDLEIDLSSLALKKKQSLYWALAGVENLQAKITMTVKEKQN